MKLRALLTAAAMALALAGASLSRATLYSESWSVGTAVPDGNPVGLADSHVDTLIPSMINGDSATIQDISVNLNISGGYNGDLYGYLVSGFNVTLSDSGASSIHGATGSPVTGTYTPDSGNTLDTTFGGAVANGGTWTLYLADLASGDTSTLVSWGITVSVVPEPVTWALVGFAVVLGVAGLVGRRKQRAMRA